MTRRLGAALGAVLLAVSASACTDDGLDNGGEKGFVSADSSVSLIPVEDRRTIETSQIAGQSLGGDPISLDDSEAAIRVVNVWGSWCTPCREEAPDLVAAYDELDAGDPAGDVDFLGIAIREPSAAPALAFERSFDIPYDSILDQGSQTLLAFGLPLVPPSTLVLDEQDRLAGVIYGVLPSTQTLVDLVEDVRGDSTSGSAAGSG